jgi:pre-mRNA-processing factor SLU7
VDESSNLRIREDTAKYLLNLDLSSAHYDPKTRSMREDPTPNIPQSEKTFAGDNFVRYSGDTQELNKLSLYAWDAYDKGQEIHMQAAPSQAQYLHASFHVKKQQLTEKTKTSILDKCVPSRATPIKISALQTPEKQPSSTSMVCRVGDGAGR